MTDVPIRQRLFAARAAHARASGRSDTSTIHAVFITRDEWDELLMTWDALSDGDPPLVPRGGCYWWRDVPFVVSALDGES